MNSSSPSSSSWLRRAFFFSREKKRSDEEKKDKEADPTLLLRRYGVTEQLREHLKSFSVDTFKDFNLHPDDQLIPDDSPASSAKNNVRQDLTEWQEQHAKLVLTTVKEISQLRYVLCPRFLKEREFWRIYFALVKSYVAPYEMHAMHEAKLKMAAMEDEKSERNSYEVEMIETNPLTRNLEHDSDSLQFSGGVEVAEAGKSDKGNLRE